MCFSAVTPESKLQVLGCEVVGSLILPATSRPFKLRMCTSGTVTLPAEESERKHRVLALGLRLPRSASIAG
jgi:hypothetical protein